jgi:O-antigen/teichoic acid export membrane protein
MTVDPTATRPGAFRRRLLHNTAATAAANGWTMVLAVASVPFLLRGLGIEAFGVWALLQTFSAVTGWLSLADLGVGLAATRHIADHASRQDTDARDAGIGTALLLCSAIGAFFAVLVLALGPGTFLAAFNVPDALRDATRIAVMVFAGQVLFELIAGGAGACLDGIQRVDLSRLADAGRRTLVVGAAATTAVLGGGLQGVAIAATSSTAVGAAFALLLLRNRVHHVAPRWNRSVARELMQYGRSVLSLNVTGVLHRTMDRLVVGVMLGPTAVALVEIATQIQNGVAAVLGAASYTVASGAAWIHGLGARERLHDLVVRASKYACIVTLPLCALVSTLAAPIIATWLGTGYGEAADLVRLALLYLAVQAPLAAGTNVLVGTGHAGRIVRPAVAAVITNLIASVVLVHQFGVAGSFVATIVSSLVLAPLLIRLLATDLGVKPRDLFRGSVVPALPPAAGAAIGGLVVLTPWPPAVQLAIGLLVGFAIAGLLVTRVSLHGEERRELVRAFSR